MNEATYKRIEKLFGACAGAIVGISIALRQFWIATIAFAIWFLVYLYIRRLVVKRGVVLSDERLTTIAEKASYKTLQIVTTLLFVLGLYLKISNHYLADTLLYIAALTLAVYSVSYKYYERNI